MSVALLLHERAAREPARTTLRCRERRVACSELDAASGHVADLLLRDGLQPGERVALLLPNVPEFVAAYYGVLRAGGIAVPLDPLLTRTEVREILQDAAAGRLLVWRALERSAPASDGLSVFVLAPGSFFDVATDAVWDPPAPVASDDTAVILYTSGTTGRPRGVELSHANLTGNAVATAQRLRFRAGDVVLAALPLSHVFGQTCGLNAAIASDACLAMAPSVEPAFLLGLLGAGDIDVMLGTPTAYAATAGGRRRAAADGGRTAVGDLRRGAAGRDAARLVGARDRHPARRGLRAHGDLAGGLPGRPGPLAPAGLDRLAAGRRRAARRRRRRRGRRRGGDGRAARARSQRHEGLLATPGGDRRGALRRALAADRGSGVSCARTAATRSWGARRT